MEKIYHQVTGKGNKKGQMLIITERPIEFTQLDGVRAIYEKGVKERLKILVESQKIKEFAKAYDIPVSTVKRLRRALKISKRKANQTKPKIQLIKIESDRSDH